MKIELLTPANPPAPPRKTRVCAYTRVSSGKDAMLHSLSAQVSYFSGFIQRHNNWEYAGVYADEAVTGTKDSRMEFNRLLKDCRAGKIDLILVKSISRFARNTLTLLQTVRELKDLNIDVFFEKENIHSISTAGELMLTVLASFAQEESVSNSNNKKWQIRKDFQKGVCSWFQVYGYKRVNRKLCIVPEEAAVVQMIFNDYYNGMGRDLILKKLLSLGIPAREGGVWHESAVSYILGNEKYRGDMLLQKSYVADPITKKKRANRGELPQYYVSNAHEPIIEPWLFDAVQKIRMQRRSQYIPAPSSRKSYPFTGVIRCGACGSYYRRKIALAGTKYAKPVWICNTFNRLGKKFCPSKQIPESSLMDTAARVLHTGEFDPVVFQKRIQRIDVTGANALLFVFQDGQETAAEWKDHSRRDSWDEASRQIARERQYELIQRRSASGSNESSSQCHCDSAHSKL